MTPVVVIGYGNPLRGDDALGWRAAAELAETLRGADVEIIACHQLTPELAESLAGARFALFIDAFVGDDAPAGELIFRRVEPRQTPAPGLIHDCDPAGLLAMARAWRGRAPKAAILGLGAASMDWNEGFSKPVEEAFPILLRRAREIVEEACANRRC